MGIIGDAAVNADGRAQPSSEVWGWCLSEDAECYHGEHETREDAIDEGLANSDGEPFYVIRGERCDAAEAVPGADRVLVWMNEYAGDTWGPGELADDWPSVTEEAKAELASFLAQWARKHARPRFWTSVGSPERIEPFDLDSEAPLIPVRASGDAGHEDGCARDHVVPGVCVPADADRSVL